MPDFVKLLKNKSFILATISTIAFYGAFLYIIKSGIITLDKIQLIVGEFGLSGYLTLFLTQFIASMTPIPDALLSVMGNILYGPIVGSLIIYTAMVLASICHYFMAQKTGEKYVKKHIPEVMPYLNKIHGGNVLLKLVIIRVFSIVSFDISAYVAGIAQVDFKTFLWSTFLGLIPITINNILIARGITANSPEEVVVVVLLYIVFFYLIRYSQKFISKNNNLF